ncbi:MAG TPA: protein kinase [Terriglobales bacterium]|jgi:serine/threonine protein kinase/roadblock/LC7 domain-containing protein|nr:protein kinase [Terriglobales bacterium]
MALQSGEKLGPYEIQAAAGAGGMGEVYRARDTRLERTVAIKILPSHLAADPELRLRLDREAKAVATLSHPNICTLYDVGHQSGVDFLVMEYLEGETLEQRLKKGPLPPEQLLQTAIQIADALERAHRQGIVHRDLKPANIMLTKSGAKLMDFGLAKATEVPIASALTEMTAENRKLTAEGTIVGTFAYMAPEQVEGRDADPRTDVFAFGEVLYEMATGQPAFSGRTKASLIAAILSAEPKPLSQVAPMSPPALDRVVRTCLAKDPDERFQTVHDLKLQLQWIAEGGTQLGVPAPVAHRRKNRERLAWASGVILALLVAGGFLLRERMQRPEVLQFVVMPPEKTNFNFRGLAGPPALSPDGKLVAFVATVQGQIGNRGLWLRSLDTVESRPLAGTEGATYPFWSPDSRYVGFFAGGKLKKLEVATGVVLAVCDVAEGRGGTWNEQGVVLFGTRDNVLYRVPASGGLPAAITSFDKHLNQTSHRFPYFLPDGDHYIYVAQAPVPRVYWTSLSAPGPVQVGELDSNVAYAGGYLLFVREGTLMAQPFNPARGTLSGEPQPIGEQVQYDPQFNFAVFSASKGGEVAYQAGAVDVGTKLILIDRTGKESLLDQEPAMIESIALEPSGSRMALSIRDAGTRGDIWLYQLAEKQKTRLTFDQQSCCPVFSPDGSKMVYESSIQKGASSTTLRLKAASGLGSEQVLLQTSDELYATSWSPDGRYVLVERNVLAPKREWEIWAVPVNTSQPAFLAVKSAENTRNPMVSPDGRWLAYAGMDTGRYEIYVVPFHPDPANPNPAGKWQVSTGGGLGPAWSRSGKELFYSNTSYTTLISTSVTGKGDSFEFAAPKPLFDLSPHPVFSNFYTPSADSQRFYMSVYSQGSAEPFTVTLNWTERLKH